MIVKRKMYLCQVWLVCLALLACLQGCSVSGADEDILAPGFGKISIGEDRSAGDMLHIMATGKSVVLGSENGKANERPAMKVLFDYDFYMGKHEVTCGEFNKMNRVHAECENDSLPISNVTFYDAILFANYRSGEENLDSVYTYTGASFNEDGHCINLMGLSFNTGRNGYRLPTEAEWVIVAHAFWKPEQSWNSETAENKPHKVCTAKSDLNGDDVLRPCDMAGNVMEWVNDWLGYFKDTTLTNYVGAPDGGKLGERVVKGGSFLNEKTSINLYSRGDTYTVTSATMANYVGFRLAKGAIPNVTWMSSNGHASSSRVDLLANSAVVRGVTGTFRTKIVFRNEASGNLVYVDYSQGSLSAVEIQDTMDVYHPDISPDGSKVAFCTKPEGVGGISRLYVRKLDEFGSDLVQLDVESAAIPRWRVNGAGDTVIVYVTDAGNNKEESAYKSQSTWEVKFSSGSFGLPRKLFNGAVHGGISDDNRLAVTGARLLRVKIANEASSVWESSTDSIWYNGEQACNVSMAKDSSKRTLFLDFAGKTGIDFVGSKYKVHERLLVMDSTGKLVQSYAAPEGYTFDHSEWVDYNLAVVSLTDGGGAHTKIALVDMEEGSVVDLVSGDDLWHPSVWLGQKKSQSHSDMTWNLDSIGMYRSEQNLNYSLLADKMPMFWQRRDSIEIVGLGNSHMWAGFAPSAMHLNAINLAGCPCDMHCNAYIFRNYILNHGKNVKYLVVGLDFDLWYHADENTDVYLNTVGSLGFAYDAYHNFWSDGVDSIFVNYVWQASVSDAARWAESGGWYDVPESGGWVDPETGMSEILGDSTWSDKPKTYRSNEEKLKSIIEMARNRDIIVIGAIFPISPYYKKTGSYGRHGMRRSTAAAIVNDIKDLERTHDNFILFDENRMGDHDYTDDMALDYDHLNHKGAMLFSSRLDSLIRSLEH